MEIVFWYEAIPKQDIEVGWNLPPQLRTLYCGIEGSKLG